MAPGVMVHRDRRIPYLRFRLSDVSKLSIRGYPSCLCASVRQGTLCVVSRFDVGYYTRFILIRVRFINARDGTSTSFALSATGLAVYGYKLTNLDVALRRA